MDSERRPGMRATNVDELSEIMDLMFDDASYEAGGAFRPRPTDIFITPYAKSGTTWLQQIAHGLRTGGDVSFDEITAVTPWPVMALSVGWELEAEQAAAPRLYKHHAAYHDINKGARYIVSFRDPYGALLSSYRFFEGWLFEPGTIDLETYAFWRLPREKVEVRGYFYHLNSWWEQRDNPDVLLLTYEGMNDDHPAAVRQVAAFMGLAADDPAIDIATRQSTRAYMLRHADKFDERYGRRLSEERAGVPPQGKAHKITPGANGDARYRLTQAVVEYMEDLWREQVAARWGFADYAALRSAVEALPPRTFSEKVLP